MNANLLVFLFSVLHLNAQIPDTMLAPFIHGVASGDALTDRVMIWTRITDSYSSIFNVSWKLATDVSMTQVALSGVASTDASKDFTIKVDVTGLQSDTWYYYRFEHNGRRSLTGRTKTLPVGQNDRIRLAVASCARYGGGDFYNAYRHIAQRNDIQAIVFLGDYIYEGSGSVSGMGIQVLPTYELNSLEDYRLRYNTYRLDPDLRLAHQQYPFYNVWDDHETANDSWKDGAEAHDDSTEGHWSVRKANGQQAFFEWLPIRPKSPGNYSIYRSFSIGNLADLILIDSRLEGRDKQAALLDQAAYADTNRTILGAAQMQWLKDELSNSQAQWRIIGNQVMFAPLMLGNTAFSNDQWDGYQADRNKITSHVMSNDIDNVVVITGDIHTSWANDVPQQGVTYNPATGNGSAFVEFITPSISTGSPVGNNLQSLINSAPNIKYAELTREGYLVLDIDGSRAQSDWYHVSSVSDRNFTVDQAASWSVNDGERFLRQASSEAPAFINDAPLAPSTVDYTSSAVMPGAMHFQFQIYPNPFDENILIRFASRQPEKLRLSVTDLSGKELQQLDWSNLASGTNEIHADVAGLSAGVFLLKIYSGDNLHGVARVVKVLK